MFGANKIIRLKSNEKEKEEWEQPHCRWRNQHIRWWEV